VEELRAAAKHQLAVHSSRILGPAEQESVNTF
jgi:hypothetical protein